MFGNRFPSILVSHLEHIIENNHGVRAQSWPTASPTYSEQHQLRPVLTHAYIVDLLLNKI